MTPRSTSDGLAAFAAESGVDVLREGREPRWVLGSADGHERRRKWWPPLPEGSSVPAASHRLVRRMARAAAAGVILVGALTGIGAAMSHLPAALDASVISLPAVPWITTPDASAPATNMAESLPAGVVEGPVADEPVKAAVVFSSTTEARSASAPVAGTVTAPVTQPAPAHEHAGATYVVEVALFGSVQRAARLVDELTEKGFRAFQQPLDLGARGSFQQVLLGPFESRSEADGDLERLRQRGRHDDARVAVATKSKAAL